MPKWSVDTLDKNLADVDPDSVGSMYDPALPLPPKGPYLCAVRWLKVGVTGKDSNEPGSPKIVIKAEISEPPGTVKAKFNGYELFKHQNVALESEAGRVNQLLLALLDNTKLTAAKKKAVLQAFHARQVVVDEKENITKIGTWVVPDNMKIGIVTRPDTDQSGEKSLGVGSFLPPSQAPKGIPADEAEDDDTEPDETEPDETEVDEDAEVAARQEELEGYTLAKLKTLAKSLELTVKRGAKEADLIDAILDAEFPPEDDEETEEEAEEEEDETEEPEEEEGELVTDALDDMERPALRAEAKALEIRVLKSMSDDDLREALREAGWEGEPAEEEDEEEDEEPEPPAKPARRGAAKAAPKGRAAEKRRKGSGDDEPPF